MSSQFLKSKFVSIVLAFLIFNATITAFAQKSDEFRVVGYYSLQAVLEHQKKPPFKRLTHVNLWFLNPDSAGNFLTDLSPVIRFVRAAHRKDVKVLFSIGGGSKQAQYKWLLQDANRAGFIEKLVDQATRYGVDGIDVDLEGSDIDEHYEKFVTELGHALHQQNKLITSAIAVYYKDQLTDQAISQFDFVNVMSYDRTGPWRPEKPGPHSLYEHAVEDLKYFGEVRKVPKEKMNLGVPFYGYGFGPSLNSEAISMIYGAIVKMFSGAEHADQWTMPDGKILYYNGKATIAKKTQLAKEEASGVMIWQLRGDAKGKRSLLKVIYRSRK
jgi:chitinase